MAGGIIMAGFFGKFKDMLGGKEQEESPEEGSDYVELEGGEHEARGTVVVRPFVIEDFADIKGILEALREGNTIGLINIRPLKDKDMIELKRAIGKLKKTTEAIEGDIAGFGEDYIIVTPAYAKVYRAKGSPAEKVEQVANQ
ncbi:MAG TPA: cell division protein SepF [Candidatus Nanoarchaeia archaeon]|nr:cell division protein SepF [Candidatus Nanoarchaeia archaeon]